MNEPLIANIRGPAGPAGPAGAQGEPGAPGIQGLTGPSGGVTVPTDGFFTMFVDEDSILQAIVPKGGTVPLVYNEDTGNLYFKAWRAIT